MLTMTRQEQVHFGVDEFYISMMKSVPYDMHLCHYRSADRCRIVLLPRVRYRCLGPGEH